jgi:hypothetical protein
MPDTPALQDAFGQPTEQRPGCGFPVARLLGLVHTGTGVLLKLVVAPLLTHDLAQVQAVHPTLQPGDVLVADRGLCSYAHLALLILSPHVASEQHVSLGLRRTTVRSRLETWGLPRRLHDRRLTSVDYFRHQPPAPRSPCHPPLPHRFSNPLIKQGLFAMPRSDTLRGMGLALR